MPTRTYKIKECRDIVDYVQRNFECVIVDTRYSLRKGGYYEVDISHMIVPIVYDVYSALCEEYQGKVFRVIQNRWGSSIGEYQEVVQHTELTK